MQLAPIQHINSTGTFFLKKKLYMEEDPDGGGAAQRRFLSHPLNDGQGSEREREKRNEPLD